MWSEKNLRILSDLLSEKHRFLGEADDWGDEYLDSPSWLNYLNRHSILHGPHEDLWILLNQIENRVLVQNKVSVDRSLYLLVPKEFADKALVLGFLPE
jgi:hypothetical protein